MARFHDPYAGEGEWLRGSLHTHTTASDGKFPLAEVVKAYEKLGYDFLAITDHDVHVDVDQRDFDTALVLLHGVEASRGMSHMVCVGWKEDGMRERFRVLEMGLTDYQQVIDLTMAAGGVTIAAHPHWKRNEYWSARDLLQLTGYSGIEIVNGDDIAPITHVAVDTWDEVLSAGVRVWGFGNDDFHRLGDMRRAWNVVKAPDRSPEAIMKALHQGRHYVSTGAQFAEIGAEGDWIRVSVPHNGFNERYEKQFRFIGRGGKVLQTVTGLSPHAAYKAIGDELYVRVQVLLEYGHTAYSQPFFLER